MKQLNGISIIIVTKGRIQLLEELLASVKRVSLYSSGTTYQIRFLITKNQLEVFAQDAEIGGSAKEVVPCEYEGEDFEIAFNSKYIIDTIGHLDSNKVSIEFDTQIKPVIFKEIDQPEGQDILMIVMPVRV